VKLVGRVPVEPLDEERLSHIERRIVARAADASARPVRAPQRGWGLALVAATITAVCAGAIGWKLRAAGAPGPSAGDAEPVSVDTRHERTRLDLGDAVIESAPSTVFVVTRPAGGVLVELARGRVELDVAKRGARPPLVVRAGDTEVVVIGTRFSVDRADGGGDVEVVVTEGVVEVVRRQHAVRVAAGQRWRSDGGVEAHAGVDAARGPSARRPGSITGDALTVAAHGGEDTAGDDERSPPAHDDEGSAERDGDLVATGSPTGTTGDDYAIEAGAAPAVLRDRTAQVPERRTPVVTPRPGAAESTSGHDRVRGGASARPDRDDMSNPRRRELRRLLRAQPVAPAMDVGVTDAAALARYYEVIRESRGEDEARAYYGIAVTQHLRLGRSADALATIDRYFRRFATGKRYPEHAAAAWLRVRILCDRSLDAACRGAARAYIKLAPDTPAARVAELITLAD